MKKTLLSIFGMLCFLAINAQVTKTVTMTEAGNLSGQLTEVEKSTITNLIVTGPIDARDFKTMRDLITNLKDLNLKDANIMAYEGAGGTNNNSNSYIGNAIPAYAFYDEINTRPKDSLKTIVLPSGITSIETYAFQECIGLTGINFPDGLTKIGEGAFTSCAGLTGELVFPPSLTTIGPIAFIGCNGITEIYLKQKTLNIDDQAFLLCNKIVKVTSEATIPPILGFDVFADINFNNCKLFVPTGSSPLYKSNNKWIVFNNVTEFVVSSDIASYEKPIRTWSANDQLFVESPEEMNGIDVVNVSGKTVYSISNSAYTYTVNVPSKGVYIVRIHTNGGVKTLKVIL